MGIVTQQPGAVGGPRGDGEVTERSAILALLTEFNGNVDTPNLKDAAVTKDKLIAALADVLGVSTTSVTRRGKSIIAGEESRTNVAYGLMPTPDRVQAVTLPTDGVLLISYQARWKETTLGAARAGLFIGANQAVVQPKGGGAKVNIEVGVLASTGNLNTYESLASGRAGLVAQNNDDGSTDDVVTGQLLGLSDDGGFMLVKAAAGSYDVSVQFKASAGSVFAKLRELRVIALGF